MVEKKHLMITIQGQVQGVGFRFFLKKIADDLGICGSARNQEDGSLYIEAEASAETLQSFIDKCRQGPASAQIKELYTLEGELKNYSDFRIAL